MTTKEFAKKWFSAIDALDYNQLKELLADNHTFNVSTSPQTLNAEGHIGMLQQMLASFTGGEHTLELTIAEGEWVAIRGRWKGKHTAPFNGIPATGKTLEFTFNDIMRVVNGKLAEENMEWDAMALMTQIGAIPQPA